MKFSQIYEIYRQPAQRGGTDNRILHPVCGVSKRDVLHELASAEDWHKTYGNYEQFKKTDLYFYLKFADNFGDITTANDSGLVCFGVYKTTYAKEFEYKWRTRFVVNPKPNKELCRAWNVPERYWGMHFDNLIEYPEQKELIGRAKNFGEKRKFKGSMLLGSGTKIQGTAIRGIGKTLVTVCSMFEYYKRFDMKDQPSRVPGMGKSILMVKEYELLMLIRSTYNGSTLFFENDILDRLCNVDYLFYDDLFSVADNDFIKRILFVIVDRRVDSQDKTTAFTTTKDQDAIRKGYPDVYDRLKRGIIYYDKNIKKSYRGI